MSANWGAETAEKLRNRLQARQLNQKVLLEKRQLLEESGPHLWIELCECVKKKCLELNSNYRSDIIRIKDTVSNQLDVRFEFDDTSADLRIRFEATASPKALTWEYSGQIGKQTKSGSCPLFVDQNGAVSFQQAMTPRSPESLAEEMLNGLIAE